MMKLIRRASYLWDLLRTLVIRDMKVKYEGTLLGFAWTLINPLLFVGVFYFVFQVVLSLDIRRYSSFALIGFLVYNWFRGSLAQASTTIKNDRALLRRPGFLVAVLPAIAVITNLIHFLLAVPILAIFLAFDGHQIGISTAILPAVIAIQFVFTLSLAYLVAAANTFFRDVGHILTAILGLGMFLTPIFYDYSSVPPEFETLYNVNPLVPLLDAYRAVLIGGAQVNWASLGTVGVVSLILFYVGHKVFVYAGYRFVEKT
ncbi:MAG: ABC transporter permease [Gammaproteobacteria bacterium]|nr:ABC transporter permease [Gammaproteobacteria bacterium]